MGSTRPESLRDTLKKHDLVDAATPLAKVSAFCRAVLRNLIPKEMWGTGEGALENMRAFMYYVDTFIHLRLYENLSLHTIFQNIKVSHLELILD